MYIVFASFVDWKLKKKKQTNQFFSPYNIFVRTMTCACVRVEQWVLFIVQWTIILWCVRGEEWIGDVAEVMTRWCAYIHQRSSAAGIRLRNVLYTSWTAYSIITCVRCTYFSIIKLLRTLSPTRSIISVRSTCRWSKKKNLIH